MADETDDGSKTEDPSQKRLEEALQRGDVVKSQEVSAWFVLAGGTLVLYAFSVSTGADLQTMMRGLVANSYNLQTDGRALIALAQAIEGRLLGIMAVPLVILVLAAIAGNVVQHRLVWSAEALTPKFSKVSPLAGAKRLFSKQAVVNFAKGLAKLALVGAIMTALLWPQRRRLDTLVAIDPAVLLGITRSLSLDLLGAVVAVLAVVAAVDYFWQYRQWFERQKMTVRELKEEFKQTEGDPTIKAKIRQIRQTRMRKRMMAKVPKASVVITNPTHYAIALQYDRGMNAPVCVAKGIDSIALKIREIAAEHSVPVVENPPLARALHATVELDQEIPAEHYKAVAEVIGYVMKLNRAVAR